MKNIPNLKVILLLIFFIAFSCKDSGQTFKETSSEGLVENFDIDYLPTSTTNQIIRHDNYVLSYNEKYEQAEWVYYKMSAKNLKRYKLKRPYFEQDKKVLTNSADWRNYKNSGYSKGHLCPAGDMKFSKKAYEDTFLTSNISPQNYEFNSGIWNRLEQKTRYWVMGFDEVYVITGGVLTSDLKRIGSENVAVPKYFYKIIATNKNNNIKAIAFLIPNKKSDASLYQYVTSIDKIEELTKIDFFAQLDDIIEAKLESKSDYKSWSLN
jgi:endonuclease G, mitochondrial